MKRALPFALLLALATSASAMSMDAQMTFAGDFSSLTLSATMTMDGQTAADMRSAFDQTGNNDGQATQAEADAFMQQYSAQIKDSASKGMDPKDMQMDGHAATGVQITKLDLKDAAGAVTSQAAIRIEMGIKATLNPGDGPKHTLVMMGDSTDSSPDITGQLRIQAPSGYIVESHNAGPKASLSGDKRTLTVNSADMQGDGPDHGEIVFAPASSGHSSPGAGLLVVVATLAVAGMVRRRR